MSHILTRLAVGIVAVMWFGFVGHHAAAQEPAPAEKDVRRAVERGVAFVEKDALAWWDKRKCNACHHGAFLLWSHNEARSRGFKLDPIKLEAWTRQAYEFYSKDLKDSLKKRNGNVEGTHLLLGEALLAFAEEPALVNYANVLVNGQQADGFWQYEGQGLKRSDAENNETTTLWAVLALAPLAQTNAEIAKSRERAVQWLNKTPVGPSNEALVARLLHELTSGDARRAGSFVEQLKKQQKADGGWSWTKERPSEAFATGQTLYALSKAGVGTNDSSITRGIAFLLKTQRKDGGWDSPSRKPGTPSNLIAPYWGSVWATMGLVRTLPETK